MAEMEETKERVAMKGKVVNEVMVEVVAMMAMVAVMATAGMEVKATENKVGKTFRN